MGNFRLIARELLDAGAALEVADAGALAATAAALLPDAGRRAELAAAAGQWHRANAGALDRTLAVLREELAKLA
jgi:3-deoxy-D-manno-octulosonic-acid transferase